MFFCWKSPSLKHVPLLFFPQWWFSHVETKYTPEIYWKQKLQKVQDHLSVFFSGLQRWVFLKSFLYAIFLKRFKHFDCDVGHEFGFQAEWEFLNGGRNWKFEELRVVSVWTERSSPWPMEGYTKYGTSAHAFFVKISWVQEKQKGIYIGDISTDFLLRIVCLIRGLFW